MITNALNDKPLPVYGTGENVRDWLYVEDHCRAIDLIIRQGEIGEIYNIGGHNEMKNIDIVRLICQKLGKPESLITYVTDRKGHDMRYAIDPGKSTARSAGCPKPALLTGLRKPSAGIWKIASGGAPSFPESTRIIMNVCMAIGKETESENICHRSQWPIGS